MDRTYTNQTITPTRVERSQGITHQERPAPISVHPTTGASGLYRKSFTRDRADGGMDWYRLLGGGRVSARVASTTYHGRLDQAPTWVFNLISDSLMA